MSRFLRFDIAIKFIILLGLVSLFSDMTYEAARGINGPFLQKLGASGATVGIVAGFGELIGYSLRFFSGYLADRTKKYWTILIAGYMLNLFSVPLLALAGYWQLAVILMITERIGKALRNPARDAFLSFATQKTGRGWGYGLHEAMDQIGATAGPLIVSSILFLKNQNYAMAYGFLAIPAAVAFFILLFSKYLFPSPGNLEIKTNTPVTKGFDRRYWTYLLAVVFVAAGFTDFPLIAFHFKSKALIGDPVIPVFYAAAMASDAIAALVFGKLFDRAGMKILIVAVLISSFFTPMVFLGNSSVALAGMIIWGTGMGAQESVMKAEIALIVPPEKRGTAFGTFNAAYGLFWFAGSAVMGILYDFSLAGLIIFSVATQFAAAGLLWNILKNRKLIS
ncbi:MAG: MFS transporter [Bacteroidales bacterium]